MTDPYAHGTPADDFHTWVKLAPTPCPDCECCAARLCELGRLHAFGCGAVADPGDWEIVRDCPCSAETTEGTEAHRAAQVRDARRRRKEGDR
ncbi:hypothetical protein ABZ801_30575 [Actinomadura sp. NPDC047616]|uniref:hypothetical protein n=1 Tax=Actinomadura sp. NPDC047616 TaxID=3155914 RepID=UPI0033C8048C